MTKETIETFQFSNLSELRDWLNGFKLRELDTVNFRMHDGSDYLTLHWERETLTDGSEVINAKIQ